MGPKIACPYFSFNLCNDPKLQKEFHMLINFNVGPIWIFDLRKTILKPNLNKQCERLRFFMYYLFHAGLSDVIFLGSEPNEKNGPKLITRNADPSECYCSYSQ